MGCNSQKNKNELIRIVKNKEGIISIDRTGKAQGRGAYICDNVECLEKVIKSKRLERTLNTKISDEIYEKLRGVIIDRKYNMWLARAGNSCRANCFWDRSMQ